MHTTPTQRIRILARSRGHLWKSIRDGYLNRFFFLLSAVPAGGSSFAEFVWRNLRRALAERRLSRTTDRPWRGRKRDPLTSTSFTRDAWCRDKWAKGRRKKRGKGKIGKLLAPMWREGMQCLSAWREITRRDCTLNIFSLRNVVNTFRAIQKILSVTSA
jgi:hypothetical protein